MDPGEQTTGTRDEHYNLVSVLYHALHGAENCEIYAVDAEAAGESELTAFFREAQTAHRQLAERAKELLGIGVGVAPEAEGGTTPGTAALEAEVAPDAAPPDVRGRVAPEVGFSPEEGGAPGTAPEDIPPDAPTEEIPSDDQRSAHSTRRNARGRRGSNLAAA